MGKVFLWLHLRAVYIDHIRHCLKGKKRNSNRERHLWYRQPHACDTVEGFSQKSGVFKHAQKHQIDHNDKNHQGFAPVSVFFDPQCTYIVKQGRQDHEKHVNRFSIGIKEKAGCQQQNIFSCNGWQQPVKQQHSWKKHTEKYKRTKDHMSSS